jgi:hypothetical protein
MGTEAMPACFHSMIYRFSQKELPRVCGRNSSSAALLGENDCIAFMSLKAESVHWRRIGVNSDNF